MESRVPDSLFAGYCLLLKVETTCSLKTPGSISATLFLPGKDVSPSQCYPPPPPQTLFRPYPFFRLLEERRTTRNEISCLRSQRDNTVWSRTPTPMRLHLVQTEAGSSKAKSVLTRCEHFNSIATRNVFAYIKMHQFFSCKSKVSLTRRDFLIEYGLVHHFMMAPDRTI